jgi:hypothetical protein
MYSCCYLTYFPTDSATFGLLISDRNQLQSLFWFFYFYFIQTNAKQEKEKLVRLTQKFRAQGQILRFRFAFLSKPKKFVFSSRSLNFAISFVFCPKRIFLVPKNNKSSHNSNTLVILIIIIIIIMFLLL